MADAGLLQQTDGNQIERAIQRLAKTGWAIKAAARAGWPPGCFQRRVLEHDRGIIDQRGGGCPFGQAGGVDEWFERGACLTLSLNDPIEVRLGKTVAASQ